MFKKLVSNLPFSPSLVAQLGFYAQRLKKEQWMRRLGLIFTVFALIIQSFAIFSPPESANAAGSTRTENLDITKPVDYITFNQYTNNKAWGDEHDFVRVGPVTTDPIANYKLGNLKNAIVAEEGKDYYLFMYVHNNAASSLNLVANNVRAQIVNVDSAAGTSQQLRGFLDADNCGAKQDGKGGQTAGSACTFWDEAGFLSANGRKFRMEYVLGSAIYWNNTGTHQLPDKVATATGNNPTLVGFSSMNGKIPGCAEFAGQVIIKLRPKYEPALIPSYDVEKKVNNATHNTAKPGDTMTYTITARNTGNVDLTNVKLYDTLPAYYSSVRETLPAGATGSIINSPHTVTIPKLAIGQTATVTISFTIKSEASFTCGVTTNFINKVTSSTDQTSTEDNLNNNQVDTDVYFPCTPNKVPNFDLEKTANKTTANPGDTISYTLTFRNTGETTLTNVVIRDTLPGGLTLNNDVVVNPASGVTGDLFSDSGLKIASVAAGQNVVITYSGKVVDASSLRCGTNKLLNRSIATSKELTSEPNTSNNEWTVDVERDCNCSDPEIANNNPDCNNKKTAVNNTQGGVDATTVKANGGDVITYTIVTVNTETTQTTITVKDSLADILEYATLTDYGGGTFDQQAKTLSWQVTLKPGESAVRNFVVTVNNPVPAMAQGQNQPSSYDCLMSNYFGNNVDIHVNCPPVKIIERVVEQLPATGPGANIVFGGVVLAIVVFFYARSRQLGKEVRLVRREFNAGTL